MTSNCKTRTASIKSYLKFYKINSMRLNNHKLLLHTKYMIGDQNTWWARELCARAWLLSDFPFLCLGSFFVTSDEKNGEKWLTLVLLSLLQVMVLTKVTKSSGRSFWMYSPHSSYRWIQAAWRTDNCTTTHAHTLPRGQKICKTTQTFFFYWQQPQQYKFKVSPLYGSFCCCFLKPFLTSLDFLSIINLITKFCDS